MHLKQNKLPITLKKICLSLWASLFWKNPWRIKKKIGYKFVDNEDILVTLTSRLTNVKCIIISDYLIAV